MDWSSAWKSSKQPKKQRKYARNAPKHVQGAQLGSHLSPELRKKYSKRAMRVRKGDKVKVMVGTFKGKTGKVDRIDTKKQRVFISGVEILKKDGSKALYPVKPSNLMIQDLDLSDKRRIKKAK
ncbi:50S ribosomal protein L24 [Candidatus Woesearchaeota archaeon]|nr:50S ribosomal protein L24 [Candidatus Woesearchaeota archaeon]